MSATPLPAVFWPPVGISQALLPFPAAADEARPTPSDFSPLPHRPGSEVHLWTPRTPP